SAKRAGAKGQMEEKSQRNAGALSRREDRGQRRYAAAVHDVARGWRRTPNRYCRAQQPNELGRAARGSWWRLRRSCGDPPADI
ncbi:MAG TPA: hypothetical protein VN643_17670, partial [Pyrinomonadaceae bacterium]|nr:hypothetical protein [Pyrinomonadaceae bacterium]